LAATSQVNVRCRKKTNGGPASARNFGAAAAIGEYLVFIDDDMSVTPDFLRTHIGIQREFGPATLNCQLRWQITAEPAAFESWYRNRVAEWMLSRDTDREPLAAGIYRIADPMMTTQCLSIRRVDFVRMNGFDTDYPYGCEDQDFAARLGRGGMHTLLTDQTVITHHESHNTLRKLCERQFKGSRDTVRFVKRFAVEHHVGRPQIAIVNGPISLADPIALMVKKSVRRALAARGLSALTFAGVGLLERIAPRARVLPRIYELVVGAYIQRGWRAGLKMHCEVTPLIEFDPARPPAAMAAKTGSA
jgi:GT2 family glycosyltransferase